VLLSARAVAPSPASTSSSRAGVPPPVQGGSFFNNSSSSGGGGASTGAAASNGSNGSTSTAESSSGARVYQSNGVTPPSGRQPPVQQPQPQLADLQRQLQALEGQLGKLMAEAQQQGGSLSPVGTQEAQRVAAQMRSLQADVGAAMAAAAHTGQSASSTPSESSSQAQQQQQQRAWGSGWGPFPVVESSVGSVGNSSNSGSGSLSSSPMSSSPSAAQPGSSSLPKMMDLSNRSSGGGDDEDDESGRVEVVSMRAGRERPWKRERDPGERQATVKVGVAHAGVRAGVTDQKCDSRSCISLSQTYLTDCQTCSSFCFWFLYGKESVCSVACLGEGRALLVLSDLMIREAGAALVQPACPEVASS
jgi:hypothetical protein